MKRLILILFPLILCSCAARVGKRPAFDFGNKLAQSGLWNEALYRWKLSINEEGESAALHNNMAIAYEQLGRFAEAEEEYKKALSLDPNNPMIKENFDQFNKAPDLFRKDREEPKKKRGMREK